jgi:nicotinamide phosphoribosyltransferase
MAFSKPELQLLLDNPLMDVDSYKHTHWKQYPKRVRKIQAYIESRGGKYDRTVMFGLQIFLKRYLTVQFTQAMIDQAEPFINAHFGQPIFDRAGWEYIVNNHNGYLPVKIHAVPEGLVIPTKNILVKIENTDPDGAAWLPAWVETQLLRGVWYPTTVATNSYMMKKVIMEYLEKTGDPALINFKLHDFGGRGVTCKEQANIGGAAHLVNFMGTDTLSAIPYAMYYYNESEMLGFSIPASEHTTVITWGKDHERDAVKNMIDSFAKPGQLFANVGDTYDIFNHCINILGTEFKHQIQSSGSTMVVRPDSGDPVEVTLRVIEILSEKFGHSINGKGYKVLNPCIRIIQGDGIDYEMVDKILANFAKHGWSADNIAFGSGGGLLQKVDRDTQKVAQKACAEEIGEGSEEVWRDIFKNPITDPGKRSKKGQLMLYRNVLRNEYFTGREGEEIGDIVVPVLVLVFENGKVIKEYRFTEVRANSEKKYG